MNELRGTSIRLVLADDHAVVRRGLIRVLRSHGFDVIQDVATGEEAVQAAMMLSPDIVLLDLGMPGMQKLEALHAIVHNTHSRAVVLTGLEDSRSRAVQSMRAGARGFVLKSLDEPDLVRALHRIHAGEVFLDPKISGHVVAHAVAPHDGSLSARELEVLSLVGTGADNDAIAARLDISPQTVRTHVQNVMKHLRIRSRIDLVLYALCEELVSLSDLRASFIPHRGCEDQPEP